MKVVLMADKNSYFNNQALALLKALPDPVFVLTRSGKYAAIFGGTDHRYYHDGSSLVGKNICDVLQPDKVAWFLKEIDTALKLDRLYITEYGLSGSDVKGIESTGPEETIWFEGRVQALDPGIYGEHAVLWLASNITERKTIEARLRTLSEIDELSGLSNRRKLMSVLSIHWEVFERHATPTTVFIFDIDLFKKINDQHGHEAGDRVIKTVAELCRCELRSSDSAARLGGDEFVVVMPHTHVEQAIFIAERLRARIALQLREICVLSNGATISGGVSVFVQGDSSYNDVLKRGDKALYQAKAAGRNRICVDKSSQ